MTVVDRIGEYGEILTLVLQRAFEVPFVILLAMSFAGISVLFLVLRGILHISKSQKSVRQWYVLLLTLFALLILGVGTERRLHLLGLELELLEKELGRSAPKASLSGEKALTVLESAFLFNRAEVFEKLGDFGIGATASSLNNAVNKIDLQLPEKKKAILYIINSGDRGVRLVDSSVQSKEAVLKIFFHKASDIQNALEYSLQIEAAHAQIQDSSEPHKEGKNYTVPGIPVNGSSLERKTSLFLGSGKQGRRFYVLNAKDPISVEQAKNISTSFQTEMFFAVPTTKVLVLNEGEASQEFSDAEMLQILYAPSYINLQERALKKLQAKQQEKAPQ